TPVSDSREVVSMITPALHNINTGTSNTLRSTILWT
ncbi:unnamed protein product, partial [marine sediment metagenome]